MGASLRTVKALRAAYHDAVLGGAPSGPHLRPRLRRYSGNRAERGAVDARDEDSGNEAFAGRCVAGDQRHVRDDDTRLAQEPELDRERLRAADRLEQRPVLEELGDDDVDELGIAAGEAPHVLEDGLDLALVR